MTTGFASHIQAAQWAQFSSVRFTGRKLTANRYHVTDDFAGFYENQQPVTFDELQFSNNASWSYVNAGSGDSHSSIFAPRYLRQRKAFYTRCARLLRRLR